MTTTSNTFTINPACKLELVASKPDRCRENIENICVEYSDLYKRNVAVATNGRAMAIVPVVVPEDQHGENAKVKTCLISPAALKAVRKIKTGPQGYFSVNGKIELTDGTALPIPESNIQFPNWTQVVPKTDEKIKFSIAFNPQFLLDVAKAIGSPEYVRVDFIDELSPMQIRGGRSSNTAEPDARGLLMPMRIAD